ncbi:PLP-dependent cysteine synthase family protein [Infirmifilum sp.]|uniref:PLP-dependent cysteine synthase family protein n=1 Tax=Infirmifilum sp. TaxID=2856575 RepID=UPI003D0CCA75
MREILDLIGNTPMVRLRNIPVLRERQVYVKLEYMNPTGSHKDRIAVYMIKDAVERGLLKPGGTIVEASSGNTAISVAWASRLLGYKAIIVVEEDTSPSKVSMIKALGAEVHFAPKVPRSHPDHMFNVAERIARERGGVFLAQYANEANVTAHFETTGPEIYRELGDRIGCFVMGVGTGGSMAGISKYLKTKCRRGLKAIAVVPRGSPVLGHPGRGEEIEGLAVSGVPEIFIRYRGLVDEVVEVGFSEALENMLKLVREEGILAGLSTGANIAAILKVLDGCDDAIVTLAADSFFRYTHLIGV